MDIVFIPGEKGVAENGGTYPVDRKIYAIAAINSGRIGLIKDSMAEDMGCYPLNEAPSLPTGSGMIADSPGLIRCRNPAQLCAAERSIDNVPKALTKSELGRVKQKMQFCFVERRFTHLAGSGDLARIILLGRVKIRRRDQIAGLWIVRSFRIRIRSGVIHCIAGRMRHTDTILPTSSSVAIHKIQPYQAQSPEKIAYTWENDKLRHGETMSTLRISPLIITSKRKGLDHVATTKYYAM